MTQEYDADIIVVDDSPINLAFLSEMLQESGYRVRPARSGKLALLAARADPPDLFLLDIGMPEMDGYEVCRRLKASREHEDIPVIFISASDETFDKVNAFSVGGVDYVTKPFQFEEVRARIETHLELNRQKREIQRLREQEQTYFESISEMKDHVVQMASHDLKSPLTAISLDVDRLQAHLADDAKAQESLDRIERSYTNMMKIITSMLDLAKLDTGHAIQLEPAPVNHFLSEILIGFITQAAEKDIVLSLEPLETDIEVEIDHVQFARVIENLLANAIKYTPERGRVILQAEVWAGEDLHICVRDTGIGIPAQDLSSVFDRFFRVDSPEHMAQVGSGLGLSIVMTIVNQHGGRVYVESEPGSGSAFHVVLPLSSHRAAEAE